MRDVRAIQQNPPGAGALEPRHQPQQRRFAAARGAHNHQHFAECQSEVECLQHRNLAKILGQDVQFEIGHYLSVSVRPRTKAPCSATTTATGGSNANTRHAITRFQGVIWSGAIICTIPSTTVV